MASKSSRTKHRDSQKPNILEEANKITGSSGDRTKDYGGVREADIRLAAILNGAFGTNFKPEDMCLLMVLLKVNREIGKPKRDNLVDIGGYARCQEIHYAEKGVEGYENR